MSTADSSGFLMPRAKNTNERGRILAASVTGMVMMANLYTSNTAAKAGGEETRGSDSAAGKNLDQNTD